MAKRQDIDAILRDWEFQPGEVSVRVVPAAGKREVLQMRIDMGVLQLEMERRPDGARPQGFETYYDYLVHESLRAKPPFSLSPEHCAEADREFVQYYHRRLCWLALKEYGRAVRDADHSLALMDFVKNCSPNEDWTWSHEQYRPFILMHRTQAAALSGLEESGPEVAIEEINQGLERIRAFFIEWEQEEGFDEDELVEKLNHLRESIREHYGVGRTLTEQLSDAVASEQYELAARLRDELNQRLSKKRLS